MPMTIDNLHSRIDKLEILISEQQYTIETLNTLVTSHNREISQLFTQIEILKLQLREIKTQQPTTSPGEEQPPHY